MPHRTMVWLMAMTLATTAQAQVDLLRLDAHDPAPRTQVLVLGSAHLSGAPKDFRPESLKPVLDRLAAFNPQIVTVEQLSGETCDLMARHPAIYDPKDTENYCNDPAAAKAATGLDVPAAIAEVQRTLKAWPARPSFAQRRRLAALFLAANDVTSAMVQWLQLPAAERHAGEGLDATLVAELQRRMGSHNESLTIAAALAARLGLPRVFPVDDHTGDNLYVADTAAYGKSIQHAWDLAASTAKPFRDHEDSLMKRGDMLGLYRFINRPDVLRVYIRSDFGAALGDPSPQHYGQIYVGGWETRNQRMAANVHEAFGASPGARVLCIVGASHKPWFDHLLGELQGVRIVDAERVLDDDKAKRWSAP